MPHSLTDDVLPALINTLLSQWAVALGWAAVAAALIVGAVFERRLSRRMGWIAFGVVTAGALALGYHLAWQRLWLCDDAYISFRYAENLARGHGLVFNVGEWVEGYTNFLWTALLGGLGWLGLDIPYTALALNLVSFAAAVVGVAVLVRRESPGAVVIPFAALALGASTGFTTFASSGLETMPAAALVVGAMLASRRPLIAGTLLIAAALARPDHLLFWGCMGLSMALEDLILGVGPRLRRLQWRRYLAFSAPLILIFVPWFLIRWHVYGDLFPNTYYAKSGSETYYPQGLVYLVVWLATSGAWLWLPLFGLLALARPRSATELRLRLFALLGTAVYGHWVVKVGGDFMLERFFIVLWPVVLAPLEIALRFVLKNRSLRWFWALPAALTLGVSAAAIEPIPDGQKVWHLAAEHSFYRVETLSPLVINSRYFRTGKTLGEVFYGRPDAPRVAAGSIGLLGYYSGMPVTDRYGLINRTIAHRPIRERGRPGHEKQATLQDLLDDGAEVSLNNIWGDRRRAWTQGRAGTEPLFLIRDLPRLRAAFAGDSRVHMPPRPVGAVLRASQLLRRADALAESEFLGAFLQDSKDFGPLAARLGSLADFEDALPPAMTVEGDPPEIGAGFGPVGSSGRGWLEMSGPGRRRLTLPVALGAAMELRFALGGSDLPGHRVELWSQGKRLFTATPKGGRLLRPVAWTFRAPVGDAELVVVDEETAPGSVLLLDAVHVPGPNDVRARLEAPATGAYRLVELLQVASEELPADDPELAALLQRTLALHWTFEDATWPAGVEVEGEAPGPSPVKGPLPNQNAIIGQSGGLLNTFHGGDGSRGRLRSAPFVVPAQGIGVRVGGGKDCKQVYVGLEVNGEVVERVCGGGDEQLRVRVLPTRRFAGQTGRLVAVDDADGPWGHLLLDDVVVPHYMPSGAQEDDVPAAEDEEEPPPPRPPVDDDDDSPIGPVRKGMR